MLFRSVFKEVLKEAELENELRPVLTRWKNERTPGERFGDFAARVLWPEIAAAAPALSGAEMGDRRWAQHPYPPITRHAPAPQISISHLRPARRDLP